jgi:hypothetical protein
MLRPLFSLAPVALLGLALLLPAPAAGGAKTTKTTKRSRSARPTPTPTPEPTPTPARYLRAAGSCMEFTPGRHLILAEVGSMGRVFRVDEGTRIETEVKRGVRLRVLYVDTPEGPVARKILPGPVASSGPPAAP